MVAFLLFLALCFLALACVSQRALYWRLQAWRHRDPEAHEPSENAYRVQRVLWVILAVAMAWGAYQVWSTDQVIERIRNDSGTGNVSQTFGH